MIHRILDKSKQKEVEELFTSVFVGLPFFWLFRTLCATYRDIAVAVLIIVSQPGHTFGA